MAAHVALLKAELAAAAADLKSIALLAGASLALAAFAGLLLTVGGTLFLGEWLFGSIGWGLAIGLVLVVGAIAALALVLLGTPGRVPARALLWALVTGAVFAVVCGANLPHRAAVAAADGLRGGGVNLDPAWAAVVVGLVAGAIALGAAGLIVGARVGLSGGVGPLLAGAVLGLLVGAFLGGLAWSWHGAIAAAIVVGGLCWPAFTGLAARRAGLDPAARFGRLWPRESVAAAEETRAWLERQWTKRRARLGRR